MVAEMWHKLQVHFSTSLGTRVMDFRLQPQTFKKEYLCIKDYIFHIKMIIDHLTALGQPIPDHDLVFFAL